MIPFLRIRALRPVCGILADGGEHRVNWAAGEFSR
jgi:hypothetical protein